MERKYMKQNPKLPPQKAQQQEQEPKSPSNSKYQAVAIRKIEAGQTAQDRYKLVGFKKSKLTADTMLGRLKAAGQIKNVICITMYNEDKKELKDTMRGVMADAYKMAKQNIVKDSKTEFLVVLIADGLQKIGQDFRDFMHRLDLYDDDVLLTHRAYIKDQYTEKIQKNTKLFRNEEIAKMHENNMLHCFYRDDIKNFEFQQADWDIITNGKQVSNLFTQLQYSNDVQNVPQINFMFAIKHNNGGKLNSHLFYFRGFCQYLNPSYATLLDIGTEPRGGAIGKLYSYMEDDPDCGGACGEIEVDTTGFQCRSFLIIFAQYFEYKISNYLDKAAQQLFGFISVLPGAFSMFRMRAIQGKPLRQYFKGLNKEKNDCFMSNMYLAQDRIMCLQILTHQGQANTLAFIPGATAITDPPKSLDVLLKQRRRWINGSNFAQFYVLKNFCRLRQTSHTSTRKCFIFIFYGYYLINSMLAFIIVGMFYSSFSIMIRDFMSQHDPWDNSAPQNNTPFVRIVESFYLILLFWMLLLSLSVNVSKALCQMLSISIMYGFLMIFFIILAYFYFIQNFTEVLGKSDTTNDSQLQVQQKEETSIQIRIVILIAMAVVIFSQIIPLCVSCRCNLFKALIGFVSYLFLTPTYINMFITYSFCNIHDVTWGNRASGGAGSKQDEYKGFRSNVLVTWIIFNVLGSFLLNQLVRGNSGGGALLAFSMFLAFTVFFRLVSALASKCRCRICCQRGRVEQIPWLNAQLPFTMKDDDEKQGQSSAVEFSPI